MEMIGSISTAPVMLGRIWGTEPHTRALFRHFEMVCRRSIDNTTCNGQGQKHFRNGNSRVYLRVLYHAPVSDVGRSDIDRPS